MLPVLRSSYRHSDSSGTFRKAIGMLLEKTRLIFQGSKLVSSASAKNLVLMESVYGQSLRATVAGLNCL